MDRGKLGKGRGDVGATIAPTVSEECNRRDVESQRPTQANASHRMVNVLPTALILDPIAGEVLRAAATAFVHTDADIRARLMAAYWAASRVIETTRVRIENLGTLIAERDVQIASLKGEIRAYQRFMERRDE